MSVHSHLSVAAVVALRDGEDGEAAVAVAHRQVRPVGRVGEAGYLQVQ